MEKWLEVGVKVAGAAVLGFIGNTLEEQGNKNLGKTLNMASSAVLAWALKDVAVKAIHDEHEDRAV